MRDPGEGFFAAGKLSMFESLARVARHDDAPHAIRHARPGSTIRRAGLRAS